MSSLIVGLGNPGARYEQTRHNVGWSVLDELAHRHALSFRRSLRFPCRMADGDLGNQRALLVKPTTFMNRSGEAVSALVRKKGFCPSDVILLYDDTALKCGNIRIRRKGSAAGHNGVQSVIDSMGTNEFTRVRIGIGPRPQGDALVSFVLSSFTLEEQPLIADSTQRAADAVVLLLEQGEDAAMSKFN